jgi:hypothetical protein
MGGWAAVVSPAWAPAPLPCLPTDWPSALWQGQWPLPDPWPADRSNLHMKVVRGLDASGPPFSVPGRKPGRQQVWPARSHWPQEQPWTRAMEPACKTLGRHSWPHSCQCRHELPQAQPCPPLLASGAGNSQAHGVYELPTFVCLATQPHFHVPVPRLVFYGDILCLLISYAIFHPNSYEHHLRFHKQKYKWPPITRSTYLSASY